MFNLFKKNVETPAAAVPPQPELTTEDAARFLLDCAVTRFTPTVDSMVQCWTSTRLAEVTEPGLHFTDRDSYESWVEDWKRLYRAMTEDARHPTVTERAHAWTSRKPPFELHKGTIKWYRTRWTKAQRRAMLELRRAGKVRSWAMKQARLAAESQG